MTPPLAALQQCSGNFFGSICKLIQDRSFPGSDVTGWAVGAFLQGLTVFVIVLAIGRVSRRLVVRTIDRTSAVDELRTLVNNVFMMVTLLVAVLAGLTASGLNINVLLTFGGLASLAIGLAFQDLLRNILAGIFLLIERPFRIGDWIIVGDQAGSVQTIQLRTTALRTADGRLAILPNLAAFSGTVVNATAFDKRRYSVAVRLPVGADLQGAIAKVRAAMEGSEAVARPPDPFVQPRLDSDGAVTLLCRYWIEYRSYDPDTVAADLVGRIHEALGPWDPAAAPPAPDPGTPAG
jgi:small conductance mechanosensitive channel